jgi:hypothetical protein
MLEVVLVVVFHVSEREAVVRASGFCLPLTSHSAVGFQQPNGWSGVKGAMGGDLLFAAFLFLRAKSKSPLNAFQPPNGGVIPLYKGGKEKLYLLTAQPLVGQPYRT